jgi:hypothetical protein
VASPDAPSPTSTDGHDARGRFAKGNRGGPGNPFARQTAALRSALIAAVTEDDIQTIARQLVTQAKLGHLAAIKLLFAYVLGKPAEAVNPDTLDVQEWQLYQQTPVTPEAMTTVLNSMHADLACTIVRTALPEMTQAQASHLAGQLDPEPTPAAPPPTAPTKTAEDQASERPAPTDGASEASEPAAGGVRQQTGETGRGLLAMLAALLDYKDEEADGPSENGKNGPAKGEGAVLNPLSHHREEQAARSERGRESNRLM